MKAIASIKTSSPDDTALRRTVGELLSEAHGCPARVVSLSRRPSQFATLSPAEVLTVSLNDGRTLDLFLKRACLTQADHPDKQCASREARVYETLLRDEGLPVVRCYGWRGDVAGTRRELLLEYIDAWSLRYHALEHWFTAARRLAGLHGHFAEQPDRLAASGFLLRFNAEYFRAWAQRAVAAVAEVSRPLSRRLMPIVEGNDRPVRLLASAPRTLVHNDLSPQNVLADPSVDPARVALVDWELGGVGCGLLDLAHLMYGLAVDDVRRMCDAYREAWPAAAGPPSAFDDVLAACQLQKVLYRLARWNAWRVPVAQVAKWVGEAERLTARL
jgi:hypothetical protein